MQRGSSRLNVHRDDEMKHELKGLLRSGHSTRSEEWHDPEPTADDDPDLAVGIGDVRSEMAKQLRRTDFPADKKALGRTLAERNAPDRWVTLVERLPEGTVFHRVQEVVQALSEQGAARDRPLRSDRANRPDQG
jgi:Protein of unknown function (DUF2795)